MVGLVRFRGRRFEPVGFDERRRGAAVPIGHSSVVIGAVILAAMLEADAGVAAERHQVGEQKAIGRLDFVLGVLGRGRVRRADRMAGKRQGHGLATPIVAAAAPFLGPGSLCLWRLTVVEEETGITFQRAELGVFGKDERSADEMARPVAAAFDRLVLRSSKSRPGSGLA